MRTGAMPCIVLRTALHRMRTARPGCLARP